MAVLKTVGLKNALQKYFKLHEIIELQLPETEIDGKPNCRYTMWKKYHGYRILFSSSFLSKIVVLFVVVSASCVCSPLFTNFT